MVQEQAAQLTGSSIGTKASICVLYDDATYVEIALRRLERVGFHAIGTTDREKALQHIEFGMCRVLIVDLKMSQADSVIFCKRVQQIDPGICMILATGYWIDSAIAMMMALDRPEVPHNEICNTYISRVLEMCGGSRTETARMLGIGRTSLYRFLRRDNERHHSAALPHQAHSPVPSDG